MRSIAIVVLFVFSIGGQFAQSNRVLDSLIAVAEKPNIHDTVKIKLYGDIGWELMGSDINRSLFYTKKELEFSEKTKRKGDIAQSESDLGNIYNRMTNYDTALMHYDKALKLRQELKHDEKVGGIYTNIATVYMRQNKYSEALDIDFKALKIFEQIGNKGKQANLISNIAIIYKELNQKKTAEEYLRKGLILAREAGLTAVEARVLVNLAGTKFEQYETDSLHSEQLDSALFYYLESEKIMAKLNDLYNLSVVHNGLGRIYMRKKEYSTAVSYYGKALINRKALGDRFGEGLSLLALGEASYFLKDYDKSIDCFTECATIFKEVKNYLNLKQAYGKLAEVYEIKKDYLKAMKFHQLYAQYKDSVFTEQNAKQMAEMQTKYETEKKELENKELKDQNLIKGLELDKQKEQNFVKNIIITAALALLVLISVTGYLFIKRRQIQQKAELDAEIARQKEMRTRYIIEAEEKERRRIAQDLHDGVGQILSAAKLNLSGLESKIKMTGQEEKDAYKNALDLIDDSVKEVRAVSHNMMPNTLIRLGLASAIREFITKIGNLPNLKIDLEIVGLDRRIAENTETVLYRVIQEIVNNIIKHAKADHISMQLIKHEKEITVMIEDNGIGFDTEKMNDFEGIGLKNIISRIEFLNGTVHFDSAKGRGTNVVIEVPA